MANRSSKGPAESEREKGDRLFTVFAAVTVYAPDADSARRKVGALVYNGEEPGLRSVSTHIAAVEEAE